MKRFLKITNDGLIEQEDLFLIGSSTKRDDSSKIGQYGSGNKFALAYFLRKDIMPLVYRGKEKLDLDFEVVLHRDSPIRVLTIGGHKTSITEGMGELDWTAWMALREVISNAIDEGGMKLTTEINPSDFGEEGKTNYYIPLNQEISNIIINYNNYFAFDMTPDYNNKVASIYFKEPISKDEDGNNVYGETIIYRKGIRCADNYRYSQLPFHINFHDIRINESRIAEDYNITYAMRDFLDAVDNSDLFLKLLKAMPLDLHSNIVNGEQKELFKVLDESDVKFAPEFLKKMTGKLFSNDAVIIKDSWYGTLVKEGFIKENKAFENKDEFTFIELANIDYEGVKYYLKGVGINLDFKSGKLSTGYTVIKDGVIYFDEDSLFILSDVKRIAATALKSVSINTWEEVLK